jgi:hypothetical protein
MLAKCLVSEPLAVEFDCLLLVAQNQRAFCGKIWFFEP